MLWEKLQYMLSTKELRALGFNLEECQTNYIPPIDVDNHVDGNSYELEEK